MRHNFSRSVTYIPEWNGNRELPLADQINVKIKPLKVDDLLSLMDTLGSLKQGDAGNMSQVELAKALKEVGHLLPDHMEITNLSDSDGPVKIEDIITYPTYMSLATELLMQCASVSMPSEVAEGNSARPPA